ncbi:MAG: aldo/keto reductase [Cyclobacteriaceae bacterium]
MENRREFLIKLAGLTAALALPIGATANQNVKSDRIGKLLPQRKLGKSGASVTMLGIGGYHIHWTTEDDARQVIMTALENGIRFFDTAESYGPEVSEIRYGKFLTPDFRDEIFLMTKSTTADAGVAREHLEGSLKRMKTDYLDLWQIHSLRTPEDVENRVNNGVLDVFLEAKKSGKVRFIGFTGHQNPQALIRLLEITKDMDIWDAAQMPINPVDAASNNSFINEVLPLLVERGIGVLAMKTLADGRFFAKKNLHHWETDTPAIPDRFSIAEAINFAWSLPISTLITGAENTEYLEEKIQLAENHIRLKNQERKRIIGKVSDQSLYSSLEYYKK